MSDDTPPSKACTKCGVVYPLTDFTPQPNRPARYHSWCRPCLRVQSKESYDSEKARAYYQSKKSDPDYMARRKAVYDRWREEHPDRAKAASDRWNAEHAERVQENRREWAKRNRETLRIQKRGHNRARRVKMSGKSVDYRAILAGHGMTCHICGESIADRTDLHFDHVIPLNKGGEHHEDNIRPAHAVCNLRKGDRLTA